MLLVPQMAQPPALAAKHPTDTTPPTDPTTTSTTDKINAPPPLMEDQKDTLKLMQGMDPFGKCISKRLLSGKAPLHEVDIFMHIKDLIYKHVMDSNQRFLTLVIPKSWHFMVLVEAHNKLEHQGVNRTYYFIKCQYYWKGMNKDICKYINNCALCKGEKARTQIYPLQMTDIPDRPFEKIAKDLVSDLSLCMKKSTHTSIDHLMGLPAAFPIPDKKADTIVHVFSSNYLPIHMCPHFILSDKGTKFKNQVIDNVLQQLGIDLIFSAPYHQQSNVKLKVFHKYLKPHS